MIVRLEHPSKQIKDTNGNLTWANYNHFGQRVLIADGKQAPRAHEVVFFQLVFGTEENPWYMEFPFVFPPLTPAAITAPYEATLGQVQLVGNPFGSERQ